MIIHGTIANRDYLNCLGFTPLPRTWPLTALSLIGYACAACTAMLLGVLLAGADGLRVAYCITLLLLVYQVVNAKLRMWLYLRLLTSDAEMNNVGPCTYALGDASLEFSGTMYRCSIPFTNIRSITSNRGTHYLVMGNHAGFIIPAQVDEGDCTTFIAALRTRIDTAQGAIPRPS